MSQTLHSTFKMPCWPCDAIPSCMTAAGNTVRVSEALSRKPQPDASTSLNENSVNDQPTQQVKITMDNPDGGYTIYIQRVIATKRGRNLSTPVTKHATRYIETKKKESTFTPQHQRGH